MKQKLKQVADAKPFEVVIDVVLDTNVHFRFCFVFDRKWDILFIGIFVSCRNEHFFSVGGEYTSQKDFGLRLVLRCKDLVLVFNTGLGFGFCIDLERILKSWS